MKYLQFKRILSNGIALALPLAVALYIFIKFLAILEKLIGPLSRRLGIERILGELTLSIFASFIMILLVLLLGVLMQLNFMNSFKLQLEKVILSIFPTLSRLQSIAAEKLDFDVSATRWQPVLLLFEKNYRPAYIIEEGEEFVTFYLILENSAKEGELLIANRADIELIHITFDQLLRCTREFGKGFIAIIENSKESIT